MAFGHGTDNAADEAFRLVTDALGDAPPSKAAKERLEALLERRIAGRVPVPYLTGVSWFGDLPLTVTMDVVIPRSPIGEVLADGARPWLAGAPRRVLDLCCGSGALGIAAALRFPGAVADLADVDPAAVAVAQTNVERMGVAERARVVRSDLFAALAGRRYDLILCNPPYVPAAELDAAPPEHRHEPRAGLDGGADGLAVWRRIVQDLPRHLAPGGALLGEAGNVAAAFDAAFPELGAIWLDLARAEPQAVGFGVFVAPSRERGRLARMEDSPLSASRMRADARVS